MTDIFFSYSSVDRERVRPVRDALVAQGFEVFWDQQVPAGVDWDTWIRQHLASCKCALVFWSSASITSRNVRHEATIADQEGKLIPVLLEPLNARQFPMGLYAQQAANLADWSGDLNHQEWDKLRHEYEAKLMPQWVRQRMDEKEAELVAERARRQGVERRDKTLQAQIAKEAETQLGLQRERDTALDEIAALKGTVQELTRARSDAEARETDTLQQVTALKVTVDEMTRARSDAEQRLSKVRQLKGKEIVRSISPFVIAAALATLGIWTYQLIWPAPQPLPAVISDTMETDREQAVIREEQLRQAAADTQAKLEAAEREQKRLGDEVERQIKAVADRNAELKAAETELQRLKDEVQRQTNAAADADKKRNAAETEQQRQAKAAVDADSKRQAAEAEQQRLKVEVQRQTTAAADADTKRRAAEAEQQRLKDEVQRLTKAAPAALPQPSPTAIASSFEPRPNMEGTGPFATWAYAQTVGNCEAECTRRSTCITFTFVKAVSVCRLYDQVPPFTRNVGYDSGVRQKLQ